MGNARDAAENWCIQRAATQPRTIQLKGQPTIPYLDPVVTELVDIQRMFTKGQ